MTASVLRTLADSRRLRILLLLFKHELCVCELVDILLLSQYEVSRQLAYLKKAGLVADRREGLWAYYSIPGSVRGELVWGGLLQQLNQQFSRDGSTAGDMRRLEKRLAQRIDGVCTVGFGT